MKFVENEVEMQKITNMFAVTFMQYVIRTKKWPKPTFFFLPGNPKSTRWPKTTK